MIKTVRHNRLRTQCGICDQDLLRGDSFVPLRGGDPDTGSGTRLNRATYPGYRYSIVDFDDRSLCLVPNCYQCARSPEAVGLHAFCFDVYKNHCQVDNSIHRLWATRGQKNLWKGAPILQLDRESEVDIDLVRQKAETYGVGLLGRLPAELIQMIHKYSENEKFWRCISALRLARELSESQQDDTMLPLCNIVTWTRGESAVVCSEECSPYIRLILDRRGIRKIERFQERLPYEPARSNREAFVFACESEFRDVVVTLEFNVLQLQLPSHIRGFQVWDTPSPPRLEDCEFYGRVSQSMQLKTINLRAATGLTFFFAYSKLYAVHAHTHKSPHATRTCERLSKSRRASIISAYLPIPTGEEIISIAIRTRSSLKGGQSTGQKPFLLFRMKLAGDIAIGPYHSETHNDVVLGESSPKLFIYSSSGVGPATVFGTYPRRQEDDSISVPFPYPLFSNPPINYHANISSAPLEDVTCVWVREDENQFCHGVLLEYENGAQRALGDYRVGNYLPGTDRVKKHLKPSQICYLGPQDEGVDAYNFVVKASDHHDHDPNHDAEGWKCNSLSGVLEFWFSFERSVIRIVE
ncbi:hypothetical protein SNK04_006484 [Fusarium graminearum]